MPIFWEGRLVAWSGIVMHDDDVGSPVPGSFVYGAADRFGEAPLFPGDQHGRALRAARRRRARLPAQQPRPRAQRPEHARARRGAADDAPAHRRADRRARRSTRSSRRRRGSSTTSSASCARRLREMPDGELVLDGLPRPRRHQRPRSTRSACRADQARRPPRGRPDRDLAAGARARSTARGPALEGAILGVVLTFLCHDLPWAIGGLRRDRRDRRPRRERSYNALSPAGGQHGLDRWRR